MVMSSAYLSISAMFGGGVAKMACRRYAGVVGTIEQLLMVQIAECSCQIECDEYCSVRRLLSREAGINVGRNRRERSAYRVFLPKAMLSIVERDVCQYFVHRSFSSVLADRHSRLIGRQFLPYFRYMRSCE